MVTPTDPPFRDHWAPTGTTDTARAQVRAERARDLDNWELTQPDYADYADLEERR